ncbi:MAG TPA: hypothetical protein VJT49_19910 [Amycolatopsis sp.]|nr:hypothetical protein [Amycolatopsis sp.]
MLVVVAGIALAITIIGWRKVLTWALAGIATLALLGLVELVSLLGTVA